MMEREGLCVVVGGGSVWGRGEEGGRGGRKGAKTIVKPRFYKKGLTVTGFLDIRVPNTL